MPEIERVNLRALVGLLDESQAQERLIKAEGLRELGDFEGALGLLGGPWEAYLEAWARLVTELARQRVSRVVEIKDLQS